MVNSIEIPLKAFVPTYATVLTDEVGLFGVESMPLDGAGEVDGT